MASLTGNGEDKDEDDAGRERVALSIWWIQIRIWDVGITLLILLQKKTKEISHLDFEFFFYFEKEFGCGIEYFGCGFRDFDLIIYNKVFIHLMLTRLRIDLFLY